MADEKKARRSTWASVQEWVRRESGWLPYVAVLVVLFLMALAGAAFGKIDGKDVVGWSFPLLGTFLGAFVAFRLQNERESKNERKAQLDAVNRTILTLAAQYNHLLVYRTKVLDLQTGEIPRMLNVPAVGLGDRFDSRLAPEELVFMGYHGEANIVMELSIEQGRFDSAREAVANRCSLLTKEIYPVIAQKQLRNRLVTRADLEREFGELLFETLSTATAQVYVHVPATVISLLDIADRFYVAAKKVFPDDKVLKVAPPPAPEPKADTRGHTIERD